MVHQNAETAASVPGLTSRVMVPYSVMQLVHWDFFTLCTAQTLEVH